MQFTENNDDHPRTEENTQNKIQITKEHNNTSYSSSSNNQSDYDDVDDIITEVVPKPCLFVESSNLLVSGTIECRNSWFDVTRNSRVIAGTGIQLLRLNSTLVRIRGGSEVQIKNGSLFSGISTEIKDYSKLEIAKGALDAAGVIEVSDRSLLKVLLLKSKSDVWLSNKAKVVVQLEAEVCGKLLCISNFSEMKCGSKTMNYYGSLIMSEYIRYI